jgi:hypothetical protein
MILLKYAMRHGSLNKNEHYAITSRKSYSLLNLAKMFKKGYSYLPQEKVKGMLLH